jgi:carboxypeptidase Q
MFDCCHKPIAILALAIFVPAFAADKTKTKAAEVAAPSYEAPQPATEDLDLGMYARIRQEGLQRSHVMEYASALSDDIGPRLTGSPNMAKANAWTRDQLTASLEWAGSS